MRIAVDAGERFGPEDFVHFGPDQVLERVRRVLDRLQIHRLAHLDEHINVVGLVDQLRVHLELVIGVQVIRPEGDHVANRALRRGVGRRIGDLGHAQQGLRQVDPVAGREDRAAQQVERLPAGRAFAGGHAAILGETILRRRPRAGGDGFRCGQRKRHGAQHDQRQQSAERETSWR